MGGSGDRINSLLGVGILMYMVWQYHLTGNNKSFDALQVDGFRINM